MSRGTVVKKPSYAFFGSISFSNKKLIAGDICILFDNKDQPTQQSVKIVSQEFPPNFVFAKDCSGYRVNDTIVEFIIIPYCCFWRRAVIIKMVGPFKTI